MSSPSGMALVRNALSSGPLTGEPSARFGGQHHGEIAQAHRDVHAGEGADRRGSAPSRPDQPLQVPLAIAADGGNARIDDAVVVGNAGTARPERLDQELGRGIGFLGRAARLDRPSTTCSETSRIGRKGRTV